LTAPTERSALPVPAAYALAIEGDLEVTGATAVPADAIRGRVSVSSGDSASGDDLAAELLFSQPDARGDEAVRLETTPAGYRMRIARFAEFTIAKDGTKLVCRPEVEPPWRWQRVLAGHALPMCALLQGIEVLHAGAAALDVGGSRIAVAIAAGAHGGKSSLSVNLALRGARLITDDALAVEVREDGGVVAHPGIGAASLRHAEVERLRELGLYDRLHVLGTSDDAVRVLMDRQDAPLPLAAIYWPERDGSLTQPAVTRLPSDPRRLLTATINLVLRDPARMRRHFEISTAIAARVPLFRVGIPTGVGAAALAAEIENHAEGLPSP
jgi:hypothetical protein